MSPRTKEQVEEIRNRSMVQIQNAALDLFAHQGFHKTSISQIAKKAKVSKGLIYNYYESKDHLLEALIRDVVEMGDEMIESAIREDLDPMQSLINIIDDAVEKVRANPTYWKLIMGLSMQDEIISKYEELLKQHQIKNLSTVVSLLNQMSVPNAELEAMYLAALLDGVLIHFIHMQDQYPLDGIQNLIKKKLLSLNQT